jgi:ABC-type transport system substrate-binding protein
MHAMYDQLVTYDTSRGNDDSLIPDAAAAMPKISGDGKTYTFALRHDVRFWNGRVVTSADWKYSFERIINPQTEAGAASFWMNIAGAQAYASGKAKHVSGIQTLGKWRLQIHLLSPDASFLNVLAMPFGSVVDKAQIEKYGRSYDSEHPMGTGPYMLKQHILGSRLILVKNPHYFGGNVGNVATIETDFGVDNTTGLLRIERNQADIDGDGIPAADFLSVLHDPSLSKRLVKLVQVGTQYITLNLLDKPFNSVLVRRAINMAINKPLIVRLINGRATVTNTILPPTMPGHGYFNLYPYNPARARQLLARAGYPHGFTTTLYSDDVGDDPRLSQAIVQQLQQVGVTVNLKILNFNAWQNVVSTKYRAPMSWNNWFMDFPDPNDFFEPILSCASAVNGASNASWYCNPKVDAVAQRLKGMQNQAKRLKLYPGLDRMVMEDAPIVPVYNPITYDLHSTRVSHYYLHNVWFYVFQDYVVK